MIFRARRCHLVAVLLTGVSAAAAEKASASDDPPMPAFVDAARRSDLHDAWNASRAPQVQAPVESARTRAEALIRQFAGEAPAQPDPPLVPETPSVAPTAPVVEAKPVPETTASIDAPALSTETPPEPAAESEPPALVKAKTVTQRKRIERFAHRQHAQRPIRTASTMKQPSMRLPAEKSGGIGPAGRMPTDYSNWNAFPDTSRP